MKNYSQKQPLKTQLVVSLSVSLQKKYCQLGLSYELAKNRFLALERKLQRDPTLEKGYIDFMREYEALCHMEKITIATDD